MRIAVHFNFAIEINGKNALTRRSWRRLTRKVRERDAASCFYCGILAPDGHADHVIPLSRGGADDLENLVWTCPKCNLEKGDMTLQEWREKQEKERQEQERAEISALDLAQDMVAEEQRRRLAEEQRQQIYEMHDQGESDTAIARAVYGHDNMHYIEKVRAVLAEQQHDDQAATIREMHDGGASLAEIQRQVYGYAGGAAYEAVKQALNCQDDDV